MSIEKTQAAFEKWAVYECCDISKDNLGIYVSSSTRTRWRTWQAAIATGIIAGCSSADNEVTFLVQALKDVANPLERFNRLASLSDGKINGMVVANLLKDPETYRDIAEEALKQHTEKIRNAGTWLKDSNVNGGKRKGGEK